MTGTLSPNTQAILLLTAPLIVGPGRRSESPLSSTEYGRLAACLRDARRQPADLLSPDAGDVIRNCGSIIGDERLRRLLERGFQLGQAVERWSSRAIWVVSRADAAYPRRLKTRLNGAAPPVLYGCGEIALLESGGLTVVGSRNVDDALVAYAEDVGGLAARAEQTVISGGARGIDQAAMRGALGQGGKVVGVLADSLEKAVMNRENRDFLVRRQLVLASPYDPSAGFNVGNAMNRNKLIYALGDAALVVSADLKKGGTWAGAIEQLETLHFVRVYVRSTGDLGQGLDALRQRGALPWPNPVDSAGVIAAVGAAPTKTAKVAQGELSLAIGVSETAPDTAKYEPQPQALVVASNVAASQNTQDPATELFERVRDVLKRILTEPRTETEVSTQLGITKSQAREWLHRLVSESVIERRGKKGQYVTKSIL